MRSAQVLECVQVRGGMHGLGLRLASFPGSCAHAREPGNEARLETNLIGSHPGQSKVFLDWTKCDMHIIL